MFKWPDLPNWTNSAFKSGAWRHQLFDGARHNDDAVAVFCGKLHVESFRPNIARPTERAQAFLWARRYSTAIRTATPFRPDRG